MFGRSEAAYVPTEQLFRALELFGPAFRTGMDYLHQDKEVHLSKNTSSWILSELHRLLANVHSAAANSYGNALTNEDETGSIIALVPRRFYRKGQLQPKLYWAQDDSRPTVSPRSACSHGAYEAPECRGRVRTASGDLNASFEGTHWDQSLPNTQGSPGL